MHFSLVRVNKEIARKMWLKTFYQGSCWFVFWGFNRRVYINNANALPLIFFINKNTLIGIDWNTWLQIYWTSISFHRKWITYLQWIQTMLNTQLHYNYMENWETWNLSNSKYYSSRFYIWSNSKGIISPIQKLII